jgi:hypothetical protein
MLLWKRRRWVSVSLTRMPVSQDETAHLPRNFENQARRFCQNRYLLDARDWEGRKNAESFGGLGEV